MAEAKKRPTGKTMLLDGKEHPTYGQVSKAQLYAALEAIDHEAGGEALELWEMENEATPFQGREIEMLLKLGRVYELAHAWNPTNSCFGAHSDWRKLDDQARE